MTFLTDHFTVEELACPCCGNAGLHPGFAESVEAVREALGAPMKINSGSRCEKHNASIGGHARSLHMIGNTHHDCDTLAVDVHIPDSMYRRDLLQAALPLGWTAGIAKNFVHLDRRDLAGIMPCVYVYS